MKNLYITRTHLHPGNSSRAQRLNSRYVTITKVFDTAGNIIGQGMARCRNSDTPSRTTGRLIADGRAMLQVTHSSS